MCRARALRAPRSRARHRCTEQRRRQTDATHAGRLEFGDAERASLDAGHEVDRLRQRRADPRTAARFGRPGANSTSAPAFSKACRRRIVRPDTGLPRRKFSARAVSMKWNGSSRAAAQRLRRARSPDEKSYSGFAAAVASRSSRRPTDRSRGGCSAAASGSSEAVLEIGRHRQRGPARSRQRARSPPRA